MDEGSFQEIPRLIRLLLSGFVAVTLYLLARIQRAIQGEVMETKTAYAMWKETGNITPQISGVCQKCGTTVSAFDLTLKMLPFGRGEAWICKEGC